MKSEEWRVIKVIFSVRTGRGSVKSERKGIDEERNLTIIVEKDYT